MEQIYQTALVDSTAKVGSKKASGGMASSTAGAEQSVPMDPIMKVNIATATSTVLASSSTTMELLKRDPGLRINLGKTID